MSQLLIVSDIFGQCAGLQQLLQDLASPERTITLLEPYQGNTQNFDNEQQAYAAYSEGCGHDRYASLVSQAIATNMAPFDLALGFSAGASALWRALASSGSNKIKQALLFYPGQIHQHLELTPRAPVQIIFGESEPHFDVASICSHVSQQPDVTASSTGFEHGFMNPASAAYSEAAYQQFLKRLQKVVGE